MAASDGGHVWPPRASDLRIQEITAAGPEASKPDDVFKALRGIGYIGSLDDMWAQHLAASGVTDTSEPFTDSIAGVPEFWSDVVLQVPFAGVDAATTASDESATPHTLLSIGGAQVDTDLTPFVGENSTLLDGTAKWEIVDSDDFDFGTSDFTVEYHIYIDPAEGNGIPIGQWSGVSTKVGWYSQFRNPSTLRWFYSEDGNAGSNIDRAFSFVDETWYHIAICRDGNNLRMFVEGTQIGATHDHTGIDYWNAVVPLGIGAAGDTGVDSSGFLGNLANVRITRAARYTANFTPPTVGYPTG